MDTNATNDRINSVIADIQENREFLQVLGCVCCGAVHNLIPHDVDKFYETIRNKNLYQPINIYKIRSDFIPVCRRCSIEFKRWIYFYSKLIKVRCLSSIFYASSIIGILAIFYLFFVKITYIILITAWFLQTNIYFLKNLKSLDCNPHDFVDIRKGKVYVKSQNTRKWLEYQEWIKQTMYFRIYIEEAKKIPTINHKSFDYMACCHCGAKVLKKDIKCVKCNQFLPLL